MTKSSSSSSKSDQTVFVHPSSVLMTEHPPPKTVVYFELVQTSKEYMRSYFPIEPRWLADVAPHHKKDIEAIEEKTSETRGERTCVLGCLYVLDLFSSPCSPGFLLPQFELVAVLEAQVEPGELRDRQAEGENVLVHGRRLGQLVEVLLDEDGALQGAARRLAGPADVFPLSRACVLLLLDADEHLGEQEALELLPGGLPTVEEMAPLAVLVAAALAALAAVGSLRTTSRRFTRPPPRSGSHRNQAPAGRLQWIRKTRRRLRVRTAVAVAARCRRCAESGGPCAEASPGAAAAHQTRGRRSSTSASRTYAVGSYLGARALEEKLDEVCQRARRGAGG